MNQTKFSGWVIVNPQGEILPWYCSDTQSGCILNYQFLSRKDWKKCYRKGWRCKKFTAEVLP